MILGFTGTRQGMSVGQSRRFENWLREHRVTEFLNGGCVGADREAASIISLLTDAAIEIYPGNVYQAKWAESMIDSFVRTSAVHLNHPRCTIHPIPIGGSPYLKRNQVIANFCDHLVATPKEMKEVLRSGTWATVRYARAASKPITIIYPNGIIERN